MQIVHSRIQHLHVALFLHFFPWFSQGFLGCWVFAQIFPVTFFGVLSVASFVAWHALGPTFFLVTLSNCLFLHTPGAFFFKFQTLQNRLDSNRKRRTQIQNKLGWAKIVVVVLLKSGLDAQHEQQQQQQPQPTTNKQQPTTNNQQPTTTNQQPPTNSQQPPTNSQQPPSNSQKQQTTNNTFWLPSRHTCDTGIQGCKASRMVNHQRWQQFIGDLLPVSATAFQTSREMIRELCENQATKHGSEVYYFTTIRCSKFNKNWI